MNTYTIKMPTTGPIYDEADLLLRAQEVAERMCDQPLVFKSSAAVSTLMGKGEVEFVFYVPRIPKVNGGESRPRGEEVYNAKLTEAKVRQIRSLRAAGVSKRELAEMFGVSRANITWIVRRVTWAWVQEEAA